MILCCGEALIDMLPRETDAGEPAFAPYPGGAVFNTAIALGRLGEAAGFYSGLSSDLFGQMLDKALTASGVDASLAPRVPRPTTLAFVPLTDGHAQYAFYDENTAGPPPTYLSEVDAWYYDDDGGDGLYSRIYFQAFYTGYYWVSVREFDGATGYYQLTLY